MAVELGLGLVILVLAMALAIELLGRVQQQRRCDRFIADLQEFAGTMERHVRTPPGSGMPRTLLADVRWQKGTPFGGSYEWVPAAPGNRQLHGVIAVTAFAPAFPLTLSHSDLQHIDRELDDGRLESGRFRTGFNGWPVYRIEAR